MSFISTEPQSRALLKSHSNTLLAQFDSQLRVIADRYLAFFEERRNIEATYVESLRRLHGKAKTVDAFFDQRAEPTTTRAAWDTVKDNLEREANIQQAFVDILDDNVVNPLKALKETNDEARKRIEEALEKSAATYAGYAENTISKLKQAYKKKYYPGSIAGKDSDPFRGWRNPPKSEPVFDDFCRLVVGQLNDFRSERVEDLGDGYDCLQELVFSTTVKNVLVKYIDGMSTARIQYNELAMSAKAKVEKALAGTDISDLKTSFHRALSASIPPQTLYSNYRLGAFSQWIFGVPLVDLRAKQGNVPKVMRMCIEEVEKRGLNTHKIYSVGSVYDDTAIQELRRRIERETSFSFRSTDNIHSIAMLLRLYLWDLPDPLFMLSLQDYRNYRRNRARYIENDLSWLRSKIGKLHPVHQAALGALLRHLLRVASHSDQNSMPVEALAAHFRYVVLRGNEVVEDGVHVKGLVLADLIKNANRLFDEPSPNVAETTPAFSFSSFSSPEFTRAQNVDPITRNLFTSTGFSFGSSPSDPPAEGHSPDVTQATPTYAFGLRPEFPRSAKVETVDSPTRHFSTSTGFSFAPSPSDPPVDTRSPDAAQTTPTYNFDFGLRPEFPRSSKADTSHFSTPTRFSFAPPPSNPRGQGTSHQQTPHTGTSVADSDRRRGNDDHPRSSHTLGKRD